MTFAGAPDTLARTLDLPALSVFRIQLIDLRLMGEMLSFRVADPALSEMRFAEALRAGEIVVDIVRLQRMVALDDARFAAWVGVYRLAPGCEALLTSVDRGGYQLPCYAQDDSIVRRYPVAVDAFVSEDLETITLVGGDTCERASSGSRSTAPRCGLSASRPTARKACLSRAV